VNPKAALKLKDSAANNPVATLYKEIVNTSVSKATWSKYSSGLAAFACFEADNRTSHEWPLSQEVCRHFALWCFSARGLKPASIRTYIAALKFAHHIKGLSSAHLKKDSILTLIMKGLTHESLSHQKSPTRRVMTFSLLLTLGDRIAASNWDPLDKQVVWTAATTSFFGSTRLGEILASESKEFSPSSDLTWQDVALSSSNSFLIRIKQPKSGEKEGEYVDIFPFSGYNCCPVKALKKLRTLQKIKGVYDSAKPVFRFSTGSYLTPARLNRILSSLLSDVCRPGLDSVSCHSFRAGIPSILSLFPDLVSSEMIKGWGRWHSECYIRYTRLQLPQREKIFAKIADALRAVQKK